jgi:hypothetical protein
VTIKFKSFKNALEALCTEYKVYLTYESYGNGLEVWDDGLDWQSDEPSNFNDYTEECDEQV